MRITYAQKIEEKTGHEVRLFANFGEQTLPNHWEKFVLGKVCFRRSLRTMLFVANPTKEESKIKGKTKQQSRITKEGNGKHKLELNI